MYYDAERVFFDCEVRWQKDGTIVPAAVYWPDRNGRMIRHEVTAFEGRTDTEVLSESGCIGRRFTVHVGGKRRCLYYERKTGRWFADIMRSA